MDELNIDTRYDEVRKQVQAFHKKHPEVWDLFCQFTLAQIERGFKHYGAHAIFQRIRWETDKPDVDGLSEFKINNNFFPFYARAFMRTYPQHKGFFRLRKQISKRVCARSEAAPNPENFPYEKQ